MGSDEEDRVSSETLLWNKLPRRVQISYITKYKDISSRRLITSPVVDIAYFFQWLFVSTGLVTERVEVHPRYFDLELINKEEKNRHEYARIYLDRPIAAVYKITEQLRGRNILRIHLLTFHKFPPADWNARQESPLFIELREADDTRRWVGETRAACLSILKNRQDFYQAPEELFGKPKGKSLWGKIKQLFS